MIWGVIWCPRCWAHREYYADGAPEDPRPDLVCADCGHTYGKITIEVDDTGTHLVNPIVRHVLTDEQLQAARQRLVSTQRVAAVRSGVEVEAVRARTRRRATSWGDRR